jgi:hypothetical protein
VTPPTDLTIDGLPYQYKATADAGVFLATGDRWVGTRILWRPGESGRWHRATFIDVHPVDLETIEAAVRELAAQTLVTS